MPRSGIESEQWDHLLDNLEGVMLNSYEDRWSWDLNGSGEFLVSSTRRYIDNNRLPDISSKTRWIKEVPIKVNVHAWKVRINGLPTRWNISRRLLLKQFFGGFAFGGIVPEKNRCITVNLHHDGVFTVSPFEYAFGDEKQITDIHFEGTPLKLGIKIIKTDSDVDEFVNFGYRNKWQVNLYVRHSGYDALDIRDQEKTMADDDEPVFANDETVVEDSENIDPKFNVKFGVTYIRHDPNQNWKKMEPVLGMGFDNPKQLKMYLANYGAELGENESLNVNKVITRSRSKIDEGTSKSPKTLVKVITFGEGCTESPNLANSNTKDDRRKPVCGFRQAILDSNPGSTCRLDDEETESGHYYFRKIYVCFKGVKEGWLAGCRKVIGLDGCFLKHTCRGELVLAMGRDANNQMYPIAWAVVKVKNNEYWSWFISLIQEDLHLETSEGSTIIFGSHKVNEVQLRCHKEEGDGEGVKKEKVVVREEEVGVKEEREGFREAELGFVVHLFQEEMTEDETQESVAENMINRVEIGFGLGDYEAEELGKQLAETIVAVTPSAELTASANHSTDKRKQVAEPQGKKKGSKRKAPASSEEVAGNQRIIFHKNKGRSERIFNQKMKKSGFGPNGEGLTPNKAFSLT
nr:hypothetical protein CTI12_AA176900 [Tanacetum cinerariifolium]